MFKKSIIVTFIITTILFLIIYKIGNAQTQTTGYAPSLIAPRDRGIGDRVTWYEYIQPGTDTTPGTITSGKFIRYYGTATVTGTSTNPTGRISGTSTLLPQEVYTYSNGSSTMDMQFGQVTINGSAIATAGSLTSYIPILNGAGSNTTLENPSFIGTVTGLTRIVSNVAGTGIQTSTVYDSSGRGTSTITNTGTTTAAGWTWTGTASVSTGNIVVSGTLTATTYTGDGSQLSGVSTDLGPIRTLIYLGR